MLKKTLPEFDAVKELPESGKFFSELKIDWNYAKPADRKYLKAGRL